MLVVLSIAIGVAAVGMISGARSMLTREMTRAFQAVNPSNAILYTQPLDLAALEVLRALPTVSAVEGRASMTVRAKGGADEWRNLILYTLPDSTQLQINTITAEQGSLPPAPNTLALERSSVDYLNTSMNAMLTIETARGQTQEIAVAGLVHDLYRLPGSFVGGGFAYVSQDTFVALGGDLRFNEVHIVAAGDRSSAEVAQAVAQQAQQALEAQGYRVDSQLVATFDQHPLGGIVQAVTLVLGIIGVLVLVLSGCLVVNTIQALLQQQTRQIGILKAIGARRSSIVALYMQVVGWFSLLALLIGVPLGIVGMRWFTHVIASTLNFDLVDPSTPLSSLVLVCVIGLLLPLLAALWPIWVASRITVRAALADYGVDAQLATGPLAALLQRINFGSRSLRLGVRNAFRSRGRLVLTVLLLTLASGVLIAVLSVQASLQRTLTTTMAYFGDDVSIDFVVPVPISELSAVLDDVAQIEQVEFWSLASAVWVRDDGSESKSIFLWAPPVATTMLRPTLLEGRWLTRADTRGVVVNTYLLDTQHPIHVGDTLNLRIKGQTSAWTVVGVIQGVPNAVPPSPYIYMDHTAYAQAFGEPGLAQRIALKTTAHDSLTRSQVASSLSSKLKRAGLPFKTAITADELQTAFSSVFTLLFLVLLVLAVLLALVGCLGLTGTLSLNVLERSREIGIMRALGARRRNVRAILLVEALTISLISGLLGVLLALPLSRVLSAVIGNALMQSPLVYTFSYAGGLIGLLALSLLAMLFSLLPARRATRLPIREVLTYE